MERYIQFDRLNDVPDIPRREPSAAEIQVHEIFRTKLERYLLAPHQEAEAVARELWPISSLD